MYRHLSTPVRRAQARLRFGGPILTPRPPSLAGKGENDLPSSLPPFPAREGGRGVRTRPPPHHPLRSPPSQRGKGAGGLGPARRPTILCALPPSRRGKGGRGVRSRRPHPDQPEQQQPAEHDYGGDGHG